MAKKVIVIGGGMAGLAASTLLVSKGFEVELFEARSFLGGRLYSFIDPQTGDVVDNGQHLMAGFYKETFRLLEMIKTDHLVEKQESLRIDFFESRGKKYCFDIKPSKMPVGFLKALWKYSRFPKLDILSLILKGKNLKKRCDQEMSALDFLKRLGQSEGAIYSFFRPLILATLNAKPEDVSATIFQKMLMTILESPPEDTVLAHSKVGLSQLVAEPAAEFIEKKGGKINRSNKVGEIKLDNGKAVSVIDEAGREISADYIISAVTPDALLSILCDMENLELWRFSPIVSVDIWLEYEVLDRIMVGFLDSPFHWCFDKAKILGSKGRYPYVSMIISAADQEVTWDKKKLVDLALLELRKYYKNSERLDVLHTRVIKEKKATVLIEPRMEPKRLPVRSKWKNLFFAGDWTDTGLPATIESAAKSGFLAAEMIMEG